MLLNAKCEVLKALHAGFDMLSFILLYGVGCFQHRKSAQKPLQSLSSALYKGHQLRDPLFMPPCVPEGSSCKWQFPTWKAREQKTRSNSSWPSGNRNSLLMTFLWGCFTSAGGAEFVGRTMNMGGGYGLHSSSCVYVSGCGWAVPMFMSSSGAHGYLLNENTWTCPVMDLMKDKAVF